MKLTVESTTKIVELDNGIPARIWEGHTESGVAVHCYITRVAVAEGQAESVYKQFETELAECRKPSAGVLAIPLRMIL